MYLDFWASWCVPCHAAFPRLEALRTEFHERGFEVLGVSLNENRDDALAFLARYPVSFALASDLSGDCPAAFGVEAMPSGYLIDRAGIVRSVFIGFRPSDAGKLRAEVLRWLGTSRESAAR